MQQPSREKNDDRGAGERNAGTETLQLEEARVVHELHHEVFPIDIDASPEIREAGRQIIKMMRFGQPEPIEIKHAGDQVKLSGNAQIEQERGHQKLHELAKSFELGRIQSEVQVY